MVQVPTGTSPDLFTDPTHIRGFSYRSFDYFDPEKALYAYGYSDMMMRVDNFQFVGLGGRTFGLLDRLVTAIANKYPQFYEFRLCHIFPVRAVRFTLSVIK